MMQDAPRLSPNLSGRPISPDTERTTTSAGAGIGSTVAPGQPTVLVGRRSFHDWAGALLKRHEAMRSEWRAQA